MSSNMDSSIAELSFKRRNNILKCVAAVLLCLQNQTTDAEVYLKMLIRQSLSYSSAQFLKF